MNTPLIQCRNKEKCINPLGSWLPETNEYFHANKQRRSGLCTLCKECAKAKSRRWYSEHKEEAAARDHQQYLENPDVVLNRLARWRANNPDKVQSAKEAWNINNHEIVKETARRYARNHPEKLKVNRAKRRARLQKMPETITEKHWEKAIQYFNGCCAYCFCPPSLFDTYSVLHFDHFVPLASVSCEGSTPTNMLPACQSCNLNKGSKDPEAWLISRFGKRRARVILARIRSYFDWVREQDG